jgi:hypothetical protein
MASFIGRVLLARHIDGPGDDGRQHHPMIENTPKQAVEAHPPREGEPIM